MVIKRENGEDRLEPLGDVTTLSWSGNVGYLFVSSRLARAYKGQLNYVKEKRNHVVKSARVIEIN